MLGETSDYQKMAALTKKTSREDIKVNIDLHSGFLL